MIQKVIGAEDLNDLNKKIVEYNKNGWSVKQLYFFGRPREVVAFSLDDNIFALLEKDAEWK